MRHRYPDGLPIELPESFDIDTSEHNAIHVEHTRAEKPRTVKAYAESISEDVWIAAQQMRPGDVLMLVEKRDKGGGISSAEYMLLRARIAWEMSLADARHLQEEKDTMQRVRDELKRSKKPKK